MTELRLPAWVYRVWSERLRRSSHAATGSSTTPARTAAARSWGRNRGEFADCVMADLPRRHARASRSGRHIKRKRNATRSEERREGKEVGSTGKTRGAAAT